MKSLCVKQVPYFLTLCVCLLWPFGVVVLGEPVASHATAAANAKADDDDAAAVAGRVIYDQRQTGKYNIHVSIKDVAIIEMDQNEIEDVAYNEDDYYYDEAHLTIKPILLNPTTTTNRTNHTFTSTTVGTTPMLSENITASTNPPMASNRTYSPNLLADIAATHAANNENTKHSVSIINSTASTQTTPTTPMKGAQNVIIVDTQGTTHNKLRNTQKSMMGTTTNPTETNARSKDILSESTLHEAAQHPRQHMGSTRFPSRPFLRYADTNDKVENQPKTSEPSDSKIYKFKVRRAHKQVPGGPSGDAVAYPSPFNHPIASSRRCRANQYRDISGNCRAKRSSSILKKLFSMLITLPFANERAIGDHDDE